MNKKAQIKNRALENLDADTLAAMAEEKRNTELEESIQRAREEAQTAREGAMVAIHEAEASVRAQSGKVEEAWLAYTNEVEVLGKNWDLVEERYAHAAEVIPPKGSFSYNLESAKPRILKLVSQNGGDLDIETYLSRANDADELDGVLRETQENLERTAQANDDYQRQVMRMQSAAEFAEKRIETANTRIDALEEELAELNRKLEGVTLNYRVTKTQLESLSALMRDTNPKKYNAWLANNKTSALKSSLTAPVAP